MAQLLKNIMSVSQERVISLMREHRRSFVRTDWNKYPSIYSYHGDIIEKIEPDDFYFLVENGFIVRFRNSNLFNLA